MAPESSDISWVEQTGAARDRIHINDCGTENSATVAERITAEVYGDDSGGEEGGGEGRSYKPDRGLVVLKRMGRHKASRTKVPSEDQTDL